MIASGYFLSSHGSNLYFHLISPPQTVPLPFPFQAYKEPCDYLGSIGIMQDNIIITRSLTKWHRQSPFCYLGNRLGFWELGCRSLWGSYYSAHPDLLWASRSLCSSLTHTCIHLFQHLQKSQPIQSQLELSQKFFPKSYQVKSLISASKSCNSSVVETMGLIHLQEKFLSVCRFVKLKNKLYAPRMQWYEKSRMPAIDTRLQKGRKWSGEKKESTPPRNFIFPPSKLHRVSGPGNNPQGLMALPS